MKLKTGIKKNWLFILFGLLAILCFIKKDNYLPMEIVTYTDTQVELKNEEVLEQTWISEIKEMEEVKVWVTALNPIQNEMQLAVLDGETREVLRESRQYTELEKGEEKELVFSLSDLKCVPGEQYIFQLKFVDAENNPIIQVKAGSNYMGCTKDGVDQEKGAAFQIIYVKNSKIFWLFSSFLPLLAFSFLFMVVWGRKWEETVGMSVGLLVFILFAAGLIKQLEMGIAAVYGLSVVSMICGIFLFHKKGKKVSELFSPGMLIFGIMVGLILINNMDARFARWDEFSHWGLAAKDMFYSNSYAKHFDSTVMMKYYPPVTTLIEYFFCYTNKFFSPGMVYVGFQVLGLCFLSIGFRSEKKKNILSYIAAVAVLFLIPITMFYDVYNCIYVDPILAFGVAYVLICYYTDSMSVFNFLRILGGLFLVTMAKDTGVVLAGILTLVMLGDVLYKQWKEKKWDLKKIGIPLLLTVFVCSIFFTWQIYLSIPIEKEAQRTNISVEVQEESKTNETETMSVNGAIGTSKITLGGILEIATGDAPVYRYEVIRNYLTKIFSESIYSFGIISLSFMDLMFVLLGLALVIAIKWKESRLGAFGVLTFIGGMGYCGFLLIAYLFAFSEVEARMVLSFDRYAGSYVCGIILALFILMLENVKKRGKERENIVSILMLTVVLVAVPIENFYITNTNTQITDDHIYGFDDLAKILQSGGKKGDNIYFVCNNSEGHAQLQLKNAVVPMKVNWGGYDIFATKDVYKKQMDLYSQLDIDVKDNALFLSVDKWEKRLKKFQYVVLLHPNEVFAESYGSLFEEPETIGDGTVYRVEQSGEEIALKYIGKTGIKSFR